MSGDFTGIGTGALYARMLAELFSAALVGVGKGATTVHALARRCGGPGAGVGPHDRLMSEVGQALRQAVDAGHLKPSSANKYANILLHFLQSLPTADAAAITPDAVSDFRRRRMRAGAGCAACRVDLSALRTVLDKLLGLETTAGMRYARRPEPVAGATRKQVKELLRAGQDDTDRLLVLMLNVLKLRPGQIAALKVGDFYPKEGVLLVHHDKPEKSFLSLLPDELIELLVRIVKRRHRGDWIFASSRRERAPLSVRALQKRLDRLCRRCRLAGNLHGTA